MRAVADAVLIVDDDDGIRSSLRLALEDNGYRVLESPDGESALRIVERDAPDIVLLDLMLPGIDGYECCRRIRREHDMPIIVVSARVDSHDVVAGLESGADDYIRKPFDVAELTARLRALRRRLHSDNPEAPELHAAGISMVAERGEVVVDGSAVHLTRTEFRLLHELMLHPGRVYTREILLDRVWGYDYFGDPRIVDVHIGRLRTKIEIDTATPTRIVTVRGFGYKLDA